jgi:serine protease AprX
MVALAATAVPVASSQPDPESAVGTIDTSMVEMLGSVDPSTALDLASLRQMVAGTSQRTSAGTGIDVALIDTGVAPVRGLDRGGKVLHGPDLSAEGASPQAAYLDTYGHGTHMAGIIAGERSEAPGIAPGARIVSVKVAGHDGVTTVPQVVAAIDWVVEHRNTDGLNIRVLNLSLGQAGVTNHVGDLLSAAVERAWDAGIVVVVAAGNRGETQDHLDSPAIDPYVISVGAMESTWFRRRYRNSVPEWSALGDGNRNPDAVAPGRSIASYRVPGSAVDTAAPLARYGTDLFLGSGTSQAAAVTSGVVAALLQYHPELTPDQTKATLEYWADDIDSGLRDGAGAIDGPSSVVYGAQGQMPTQNHPKAAGAGTGIATPTGATWSGGGWTGASWSGASWSGTVWSGASWSGASWSGASWSGASWSGASWSGASWSGASWSGASWSGASWSGASWSGASWS